jgi:hypothetical protein
MDTFNQLTDLSKLIPILVFLLPGFVTLGVIEVLVVSRPRDTFDKIVLAFVLTFLNLLVFSVMRYLLEKAAFELSLAGCLMCSGLQFDHVNFYSPGNLILILICSVGIGLIWGYETTNESVLKRLRDKNFTTRTHKPSTWREAFIHRKAHHIVVHLKDGRRIFGYPLHYSDEPGERAVLLEPAYWLTEKNGKTIQGTETTILIDNNIGIELIEFVDDVKEVAGEQSEAGKSNAEIR